MNYWARSSIAARVVVVTAVISVMLVASMSRLWYVASERARLLRSDSQSVLTAPWAIGLARTDGARIYASHCAGCHGDEGRGSASLGAPDLSDREWLYGQGLVAEIEAITLHGIRSGDAKGWHLASMPAYGRPRPYSAEAIPSLSPDEIADVTAFVRSLNDRVQEDPQIRRGGALFRGRAGCWDCHGPEGRGDAGIGAPNLTDQIWLYGHGDVRSVTESITRGRAGFSPAFAKILSPYEARVVALYVARLPLEAAARP